MTGGFDVSSFTSPEAYLGQVTGGANATSTTGSAWTGGFGNQMELQKKWMKS